MTDVSGRIKKIEPYFRGMKVDNAGSEQVIYVMIELPPRWEIQPETEDRFDVSIGRDGGLFYFCAELEQGFDVIFNAIDYNIEKMKVAVERAQLFKQKTDELQKLFSNESISLEALKTLDFTYRGKKKKTTQPKASEGGVVEAPPIVENEENKAMEESQCLTA